MLSEGNWSLYYRVSGLCNLLKYFETFFKYPDWDYFDLKNEYKELQKEYNKLKRVNHRQNRRLEENGINPV
ncbi:hypothetical protein DDZ16_09120 [Marinilabilia rubra]|uniref:Uncharacterized protein n=2 Tax=Marinilabilia rubra TaxID=2162893 RepID=A0A2U2B945_9BACT|nr:hypothetical protein DDZ16_09120 [Marinilabilia rubra]